jgi:type VI secretion system protein ImpH
VATQERRPAASLADCEALAKEASQHGFVAVTALLERLTPEAPRVGGVGPVTEETIRFRHDPALGFSVGDVSRVRVRDVPEQREDPLSPTRRVFEIMTTFLGLTGTVSPLPAYMVEEVALEDEDVAARREFLDIFHHRALSLFYRLLVKLDLPREFRSDLADPWSQRVLALLGWDAAAPFSCKLPRWRLLRLAPIFSSHVRSADGLKAVLNDLVGEHLDGAQIELELFVGQWSRLDLPLRIRLGVDNTTLGQDMFLGQSVWDRSRRFRVVIGPFTTAAYQRYLPGGDLADVVRDAVTEFLSEPLACELEVRVAADVAPAIRLTQVNPHRLGAESYLGRRKEETRIRALLTDGA